MQLSDKQQTIINEANSRIQAVFKANPHQPDEKEMTRIAVEAAKEVVNLFEDGVKFQSLDIEKAGLGRASKALRAYLARLAEKIGSRQLYEVDRPWYMWMSE